KGVIGILVVDRLAGVFLHMNTRNADILRIIIKLDMDVAPVANGRLMLRYLISFGQIGIKVVFTGKNRLAGNAAIGSQSHFDNMTDQIFIEYRKGSRMA